MNIPAHLDALEEKHAELEEKIHDAYIHHLPVNELKKKKLKVKEEIELVKNGHFDEAKKGEKQAA